MRDKEPYDAGEKASVEKRKTKDQLKAEKEREQMRTLLSHRWGRDILWRLLERAGVYRTTFTGNSETFFKEGRRSLGLDILNLIVDADIKAYGRMREEAKGNDDND